MRPWTSIAATPLVIAPIMATSRAGECSAAASTSGRTPPACWSPRRRPGGLREVLQRRAFTRLGRGLAPGGTIPAARIAETAAVVAEQHALAEQAGASTIRAVATAVIRRAANRDEFCRRHPRARRASRSTCSTARRRRGWRSWAPRGPRRCRCRGASRWSTSAAARPRSPSGRPGGGVEWAASFEFGSGFLADAYLGGDPPDDERAERRAHARLARARGDRPGPGRHALAVGGSAASLRRLVGAELNEHSLAQALRVLDQRPGDGRRGALRPRRPAGPADARRPARARRRRARARAPAADRLRRPA